MAAVAVEAGMAVAAGAGAAAVHTADTGAEPDADRRKGCLPSPPEKECCHEHTSTSQCAEAWPHA